MDTKELQVQLDEMKSGLERLAVDKATAAAASAIVGIKEALETQNADLIKKSFRENIVALKELLPELSDVTSLKEWKEATEAIIEKNQAVIDDFSAAMKEGKLKNNTPKIHTIKSALEEALNEGDNFKNLEMLALNHKDRNKRFSIELKTVGDMTTGNVTGGSRYGAQYAPGIIEPNKRKVHVRSLVPMGNAGPGNTFTFMRETGAGEGSIAPTLETSTKPQFDLDLVETTVNFEVIAGWLRVTRKAMNNIPGFLSYLNSRLPEKLLRAEDKQLLVGDGTSPNISGIMDSGNYTAADTTENTLIEAIIDSIAQLEDEEERDATGILIRPRAYYSFFKNKAAGSGEYDLPKNVTFENGVLYISGIPVYASTAMNADAAGSEMNKFIVGDWEMGAQLLIQEAMRVEFFEQDGTNVRENKITVRVEETVAFPIFGSNYFIVGNDPDAS